MTFPVTRDTPGAPPGGVQFRWCTICGALIWVQYYGNEPIDNGDLHQRYHDEKDRERTELEKRLRSLGKRIRDLEIAEGERTS